MLPSGCRHESNGRQNGRTNELWTGQRAMKYLLTHANNIRFAYYTVGSGPRLLLLLHGFPDDAATMLPLMERLDHERFTLVAPNLRGYAPSSAPIDGRYSLEVLAQDVIAMIDAMGFTTASVVGHDWGALAAYSAAQLDPSRIDKLCAISVPPPRVFLRNLTKNPQQLSRSAYIFFFQLPLLPERLLASENYGLIEQLWSRWSPEWRWRDARHAKVLSTFMQEDTPASALGYYRALLRDMLFDPSSWRRSCRLAMRRLTCPSLILHGKQDGCIGPEMYRRIDFGFTPRTPYRVVPLENCGHFPQQEKVDEVAHQLSMFLGA